MRKLLFISVFMLSSFSLLTAQKKQNFGAYIEIGSELPTIKAVDGKLKTYTAADFSNEHNFFVIMFNPTCGHCISVTRMIGENSAVFKNNHMLFLASSPMLPYFPDFLEETNMYKHPEMIVAVDSAYFIEKAYSYIVLPQINIYDANRKLIKTFTGETSLDSLRVYAK